MNINQLIKIVEKKLKKSLKIEYLKIEDKSFLHKNHKSNEEGKFHLKLTITSKEFSETSKIDSMRAVYGNPSSTHHFGRSAKSLIENARKGIAKNLGVNSSEIIFTSGGTEANNLILRNAVVNLGVTIIVFI